MWKAFVNVALLGAVIVCLFCEAAATQNDSADTKRAMKNLALHADSVQESPSTPSLTEQDQIDGIKSAFLKLPSEELARLGVDVHHSYVAGTEEAVALQAAWAQRQIELKEMMEKQLKAADFMSELAGYLVNASVPDEEALDHLDNLEHLLADIDNARDFHNIGKWSALTSLLPGLTQRSIAVQTKALHCIGTAVKNDYDFQLWVLEAAGGQPAGEEKLVVEILSAALSDVSRQMTSTTLSEVKIELDGLLRRILYALTSAARGNLDVQAALSAVPEGAEAPSHISFVDQLKECVDSPKLSVGVKRKCWHIVSDLLDEMVYIRHDVAHEYAAMQREQTVAAGGEVSEDALADKILQILNSLQPMGMSFVRDDYQWLLRAEEVAGQIASSCQQSASSGNKESPQDSCIGRMSPEVRDIFTQSASSGDKESPQDSCIGRMSPEVRDIFTHVIKVRSVLRSEYGSALDGDDDRLTALRSTVQKHAQDVQTFLEHPLMQDKLY
eukprot:CAMPEP_0114441484 /NCGR_PEP_ID=MMETSP0103-20121206/16399_1 /TAXON_ID=37642 ORGANISM="Paraphysomonas imperforata, Strain PA2" /NCGR_SAMPLE_ID=MMETSP0103 /ASSEMBLY_ACC=CAM_ASM_000201 /LENGTH=498 /DNA_ID=CAMNT_0001612601 /DNA_START=56 /DNA_END=1552 /DNA_ORIENTATION=+